MTQLVRSKRTSVRLSQRARIVLLAAQGMQNEDIAVQLDIGRVQVSRWRERFAESWFAGIERDLPRGAPPVTVDVARLVELTTQSKPEAATHWSTRTMAAELGISAASSRHWRKNGLKPHLVRGFKVSRNPQLLEKLEDIVGLCLSPPEHAMVLCCDEKSPIWRRNFSHSAWLWRGRPSPRPANVAAIAALRGIGRREVAVRLESLKQAV